MRRLWVLPLLGMFALSAVAAEKVSVRELELRVAGFQHQSDKAAAKHIALLQLTERLSQDEYLKLSRRLPGKESTRALTMIGDIAAFLPSLPSAATAAAAPSDAEQGKILVRAADAVVRESKRMPNFLAERTTMRFEDAITYPFSAQVRYFTRGQFHFVDSHTVTVRYSQGKEEELTKRNQVKDAPQIMLAPLGLTTWGAFGPLVQIVMADVLQAKVGWDHWEGSGQDRRAVFRFFVPKEKSHYTLEYCCTLTHVQSKFEMTEFKATPAYHGRITIDPETGHVVHLALLCDLAPKQVITRAGTELEYGPVQIAGQTYFLPLRGVSFSTNLTTAAYDSSDHYKLTAINDLQFGNYRVFRTEMKILPAETADKAPQ